MVQNEVAALQGSRVDMAALLHGAQSEPKVQEIIDVITGRASAWIQNPTLAVPGELGDWWHVSWERLSDVAFAQAASPLPDRAEWLRAEVLRICSLPVDEWVGPFFRPRFSPVVGMLETAHVGLGVATVLELCPGLLDAEETRAVHAALVEKCLLPCERALIAREKGFRAVGVSGAEELVRPDVQNWYWVLLDAYGAVALLTGDADRVAALPERFNFGQRLHNSDSYGESVQYWGYAAIHITNLLELIAAYAPELVEQLTRPHEAMMPWLVQSVMFSGQARELGPGSYTTMVNFADSAYTARPPADVLLSVSRFASASDPVNAGLARWLFDLTYSDTVLAPTELSSFGFFNQVGWRSAVNLLSAAAPLSPAQAALPLAQGFGTGTVVVRDSWTTTAVLAAQAGHEPLNVDSHRHDDYGSFVLGFGGEVFFTDPGHCSYRLRAYQDAVRFDAHNTWILRDAASGEPLERSRSYRAAVGKRHGPAASGDAVVFSVDLADLYPATVRLARRTWISILPHIVVIVDTVEADEPVLADTQFVLNNRDNQLTVNEASSSRLVLRRDGAAVKFFRLAAEADGVTHDAPLLRSWSALHDIYQPQVNAPTQGKEGSGVVYTFPGGPANRFTGVYSVVMSAETDIRGWHINYHDGAVHVSPPAGEDIVVNISDHLPA